MKFAVVVALLPLACAASWTSARRDRPGTTLTGQLNIVVNSTYTIGPVSSTLNSCGEYGTGPSVLLINASVPADGSPFEIAVANAPYPRLGAAVGFASTSRDLLPGSVNYVVLTPVASVARGAASPGGSAFADTANAMGANLTSTVASAVWTFNASAGTLVPAWTNSNGKAATATLLYDLDANVLLLAGDMGVFNTVLRSNAVKVTLVVSS